MTVPVPFPHKTLIAAIDQGPQRYAVIASVRRAEQRVDVELGRLAVGQEHAGVVVELDYDDRRPTKARLCPTVLIAAGSPQLTPAVVVTYRTPHFTPPV